MELTDLQAGLVSNLLLELDSTDKLKKFLTDFSNREDYTAMAILDAFDRLCLKLDVCNVRALLDNILKDNILKDKET